MVEVGEMHSGTGRAKRVRRKLRRYWQKSERLHVILL
jgi:hypothetical protein